jgi:hypothetical protein
MSITYLYDQLKYLFKLSDSKYRIDENFMVFTFHQILFRCSNQEEIDGRSTWHLLENLELHREFWWGNQGFYEQKWGKGATWKN